MASRYLWLYHASSTMLQAKTDFKLLFNLITLTFSFPFWKLIDFSQREKFEFKTELNRVDKVELAIRGAIKMVLILMGG